VELYFEYLERGKALFNPEKLSNKPMRRCDAARAIADRSLKVTSD
jgi:hypothetical protein